MMPLNRHQSSLEDLLNFSPPFTLSSPDCQKAEDLLASLINVYGPDKLGKRRYKPAVLVSLTYENIQQKDAFLRYLLIFMHKRLTTGEEHHCSSPVSEALSFFCNFSSWDKEEQRRTTETFEDFADFLLDNFYFPVRSSSFRTPQPTPAPLSAIQTSPPSPNARRVSDLRHKCLIRDRHRCIVSRHFDQNEARQRLKQDGQNYRDDDGHEFRKEVAPLFSVLQVAHILPHALLSTPPENTVLSDAKKTLLNILDMFDRDVALLIDGPKIDSPQNALTLTVNYHQSFAQFQIYFEATERPHEYRIINCGGLPDPLLPVTRSLYLSADRTIDPPSSRLLAIHRAIARILHLSGAGDYLFRVLRDMDDVTVKEDGSTNLADLVRLGLGGWSTLPVY